MIAIGDLHIKTKLDISFEYSRIDALTHHLISLWGGKNEELALLGDVFDSNSPSLEDIKLFYTFIEALKDTFKSIYVICGNHDYKVFNFIPQIHFTFIPSITTIDNFVFVPWTHISDFINASALKNKQDFIVLTHARCTVPPHIREEVNISVLSNKFKLAVLGDIHMPYEPFSNVLYTSEPTQNSYKTYSDKTTGYIHIDRNGNIERVFTDLPRKEKLQSYTVEQLDKLIPTLPNTNRYKIIVKDTVTNLKTIKKFKQKHIVFDVEPIIADNTSNDAEDLRKLLDGKISLEQLLFTHVTEQYALNTDIQSNISRMLK